MAICYNCFHNITTEGKCPLCGYDPTETQRKYRVALQPRTLLFNRYIVGRVLGQGGFGITYVAFDSQSQSRVAIKEFFPTDFVSRDIGTKNVELLSRDHQADYEYGKQQFLNEAKTLIEFVGNEHIIGIRSYFEENGTAYFAMEYVEGVNLKQYMEQYGGPLPINEANKILLPIMEALQWVHSKGIIHRDIAPDNIMIRRDLKAKLIDFGAARYSTGEKSKSLDVLLKHGFAPYEQYSRRGRQGPFTDVYAMAGTYYYAITGKIPPDAIDRAEKDDLMLPSDLGITIKPEIEAVLKKALAVSSKERYQTMADFYSALLETMPSPYEPQEVKGRSEKKRESTTKHNEKTSTKNKNNTGMKQTNSRMIAIVITAAIVISVWVVTYLMGQKEPANNAGNTSLTVNNAANTENGTEHSAVTDNNDNSTQNETDNTSSTTDNKDNEGKVENPSTSVQETLSYYVSDAAGLLSSEQQQSLETAARAASEKHACGIYIITIDDFRDFGFSSVDACAEGFYNHYQMGLGNERNGILLLLSMNDRDYALKAYGGGAHEAFTDYGSYQISDSFIRYFRQNDWYGGFADYISNAEDFLTRAAAGNPVDVPLQLNTGVTSSDNITEIESSTVPLGNTIYLNNVGGNEYTIAPSGAKNGDKALRWYGEYDSYYDTASDCYVWYNSDADIWQYWYDGISSDYGDYGWMEHYDDGWFIEASYGNWIPIPSSYDLSHCWYIS